MKTIDLEIFKKLFLVSHEEDVTDNMVQLLSHFSKEQIEKVIKLTDFSKIYSRFCESGDLRLLSVETALKSGVGVQDAVCYAFLHHLPEDDVKMAMAQIQESMKNSNHKSPLFDSRIFNFSQSSLSLYILLMKRAVGNILSKVGNHSFKDLLESFHFNYMGDGYAGESCIRLMIFTASQQKPDWNVEKDILGIFDHCLAKAVCKNPARYILANNWQENIQTVYHLAKEIANSDLNIDLLPNELFQAVFVGAVSPENALSVIESIGNMNIGRNDYANLLANFFNYVLRHGFCEQMLGKDYLQHLDLSHANEIMKFYLLDERPREKNEESIPNFSPIHIRRLANTTPDNYYNEYLYFSDRESKALDLNKLL